MSASSNAFAPYFATAAQADDGALAGYARGFDEGRQSVEAQADRLLASALAEVEATLLGLNQTLIDRFARLEADAAALALVFARQLAAGAVPHEDIVERTFAIAMTDFVDAPAVTLNVHPDIAGRIEPKLRTRLEQASLAPRLFVVPDPETRPGDCRISWRGGSVSFSRELIEQRLAAAITRIFPQPETHA